jgi:hypothetical protein
MQELHDCFTAYLNKNSIISSIGDEKYAQYVKLDETKYDFNTFDGNMESDEFLSEKMLSLFMHSISKTGKEFNKSYYDGDTDFVYDMNETVKFRLLYDMDENVELKHKSLFEFLEDDDEEDDDFTFTEDELVHEIATLLYNQMKIGFTLLEPYNDELKTLQVYGYGISCSLDRCHGDNNNCYHLTIQPEVMYDNIYEQIGLFAPKN